MSVGEMKSSLKIVLAIVGLLLSSLLLSAQVAEIPLPYYNLAAYGAIFDAVQDTTCSMDGSTANLTCTDAPFPSPCPVGKVVGVNNALAGGLELTTSIVSCSSATVAVLATASTNATGPNVSAIWGTDNFAALQSAVTAAAGGTLQIPSGVKFLVKLVPGAYVTVPSNTSIVGNLSHSFYVIGVPGTMNGDPSWNGAPTYKLFNISDPTNNVTISGLHIVGTNNPYVFKGLNQSNIVYGLGISRTSIQNIHTNGNLIEYVYGFSFHNAGQSASWDAIGNTFRYVGKGLNINSNHSLQMYNHFWYGGGLETSGDHTNVSYNDFHLAGLEYVMSLGGNTSPGTSCLGVIASYNIMEVPAGLSGIAVGDCLQFGDVSHNQIEITTIYGMGIFLGSSGYNAVAHNSVSDNQITGAATACLYTAVTSDNYFDHNRCTGAAFGAIFGDNSSEGPEYSEHNLYTGSSQDMLVNGAVVTSIYDALAGTGTYAINSGSISAASVLWHSAATGKWGSQ